MAATTNVEQRAYPEFVDRALKAFVENKYKPFLAKAIEYRYTTLASRIDDCAGFRFLCWWFREVRLFP